MKRLYILVVLLISSVSVLIAEADNYFFCNVGPDRPIHQETWGIHAGIGGFGLLENVLLFGGFGEYFGTDNERMHLGNGGAILGIGHIFGRRLVLSVEGIAGLGGGIINQEAGVVYVYGVNAIIGHRFARGVYLGIGAGYRSICRFVGFSNSDDTYDYLSINFWSIFGP
jgi:hypothetical protein